MARASIAFHPRMQTFEQCKHCWHYWHHYTLSMLFVFALVLVYQFVEEPFIFFFFPTVAQLGQTTIKHRSSVSMWSATVRHTLADSRIAFPTPILSLTMVSIESICTWMCFPRPCGANRHPSSRCRRKREARNVAATVDCWPSTINSRLLTVCHLSP